MNPSQFLVMLRILVTVHGYFDIIVSYAKIHIGSKNINFSDFFEELDLSKVNN